MKKIALVIVMVFAFSLTQAGNHVVVKTTEHNSPVLQLTTTQGTNLQKAPVFDATTIAHHATKTKRPKADKKPKTKKTKEHKDHQAQKAEHQKKREANRAKREHHENSEHHHHKKTDKK